MIYIKLHIKLHLSQNFNFLNISVNSPIKLVETSKRIFKRKQLTSLARSNNLGDIFTCTRLSSSTETTKRLRYRASSLMIVIPDYFYRRVALRISRTATAVLTPLIRDNCIRGQCRATLQIDAE